MLVKHFATFLKQYLIVMFTSRIHKPVFPSLQVNKRYALVGLVNLFGLSHHCLVR